MAEESKTAPISLRKRHAARPSFDRISDVAAALTSRDSQYPSATRDAVVGSEPLPVVERADADANGNIRRTVSPLPGRRKQARATEDRSSTDVEISWRVRIRCDREELRALRAYAALQGVALSDLLSDALKPLVARAVGAMRG